MNIGIYLENNTCQHQSINRLLRSSIPQSKNENISLSKQIKNFFINNGIGLQDANTRSINSLLVSNLLSQNFNPKALKNHEVNSGTFL